MKIQHKLQQEQGFTLIELMAVLAILTMLVLIAVPAIGSITKKAEAQADDATISMIEKAGGLALLGDVAYDDPEEEQYEVATLVEEGYLDIDDSHKYAGDGNNVTRVKGFEFEFEGAPEPIDPEVVQQQMTATNVLLNKASMWSLLDKNGGTAASLYYAWLNEPFEITLPAGDYAVNIDELVAGTIHLTLSTLDENGQVLNTVGPGLEQVPFTITEDVDAIMIRLMYINNGGPTLRPFVMSWLGNDVKLNLVSLD